MATKNKETAPAAEKKTRIVRPIEERSVSIDLPVGFAIKLQQAAKDTGYTQAQLREHLSAKLGGQAEGILKALVVSSLKAKLAQVEGPATAPDEDEE